MDSLGLIRFLHVISMGFRSSSQAYKFYVGGRDGWISSPSEKFNEWAERNRFQSLQRYAFKRSQRTIRLIFENAQDGSQRNRAQKIWFPGFDDLSCPLKEKTHTENIRKDRRESR